MYVWGICSGLLLKCAMSWSCSRIPTTHDHTWVCIVVELLPHSHHPGSLLECVLSCSNTRIPTISGHTWMWIGWSHPTFPPFQGHTWMCICWSYLHIPTIQGHTWMLIDLESSPHSHHKLLKHYIVVQHDTSRYGHILCVPIRRCLLFICLRVSLCICYC